MEEKDNYHCVGKVTREIDLKIASNQIIFIPVKLISNKEKTDLFSLAQQSFTQFLESPESFLLLSHLQVSKFPCFLCLLVQTLYCSDGNFQFFFFCF